MIVKEARDPKLELQLVEYIKEEIKIHASELHGAISYFSKRMYCSEWSTFCSLKKSLLLAANLRHYPLGINLSILALVN